MGEKRPLWLNRWEPCGRLQPLRGRERKAERRVKLPGKEALHLGRPWSTDTYLCGKGFVWQQKFTGPCFRVRWECRPSLALWKPVGPPGNLIYVSSHRFFFLKPDSVWDAACNDEHSVHKYHLGVYHVSLEAHWRHVSCGDLIQTKLIHMLLRLSGLYHWFPDKCVSSWKGDSTKIIL